MSIWYVDLRPVVGGGAVPRLLRLLRNLEPVITAKLGGSLPRGRPERSTIAAGLLTKSLSLMMAVPADIKT